MDVLRKNHYYYYYDHHHLHHQHHYIHLHLLFLHSKILCVITYGSILNFINQVVGVVLENYGGFKENTDETRDNKQGLSEVDQVEGHMSSSPDAITMAPSWRRVVNEKGQINVTA